MSDISTDTIAAIATPSGEGGIGVIRISGSQALGIAEKIAVPVSGSRITQMEGYRAALSRIADPADPEKIIDEALVLVMRTPKSFTGEDVAELHCHGGTVLLKRVLELILRAGARLAEPGEFTRRAFLNGKIDLTKAENVLSMISAKTDRAYEVARQQLTGRLSDMITGYRDDIAGILSHVEASIDFSEDNISPMQRIEITDRLEKVRQQMILLIADAKNGIRWREGIKVVLTGLPNAGKSSIMNLLAKTERVIVSPRPGTTRDVIEETLEIDGFKVRLFDTAGLAETDDMIDLESMKRTRKMLDSADLILFVTDVSRMPRPDETDLWQSLAGKNVQLVANKMDCCLSEALKRWKETASGRMTEISCKDDSDLRDLTAAIAAEFGTGSIGEDESPLIDSVRQMHCLENCSSALEQAINALRKQMPEECAARDLREALDALGQLVGEVVTDDILGLIFSQFCIGK